jgi:hypothetical protein
LKRIGTTGLLYNDSVIFGLYPISILKSTNSVPKSSSIQPWHLLWNFQPSGTKHDVFHTSVEICSCNNAQTVHYQKTGMTLTWWDFKTNAHSEGTGAAREGS